MRSCATTPTLPTRLSGATATKSIRRTTRLIASCSATWPRIAYHRIRDAAFDFQVTASASTATNIAEMVTFMVKGKMIVMMKPGSGEFEWEEVEEVEP